MAAANLTTRFILKSLDTNVEWDSQYQPISVRHTRQSNWMDVASVNRDHPFTMWVSGRVETIQFQIKLFAHSLGMIFKDAAEGLGNAGPRVPGAPGVPQVIPAGAIDLVDKVEDLEKLYYKDINLGRPHILQFIWGRLNLRVVITDLTTEYSPLDSVGVHREVTINMALKRYEEVPAVEEVSRIAKVNESRFYSVKLHESYESIAMKQQFYKNPKFGEFLRRRHPEFHDLEVTDQIHIPPRSSTVGFSFKPQSVPFSRSDANAIAALALNRERAADRVYVSTIITTAL